MKKTENRIIILGIIIVFFLALFIPSLKVNAHSYHHTQPMVDIIVRYSEKIPDEGELEPTYKTLEHLRIVLHEQ